MPAVVRILKKWPCPIIFSNTLSPRRRRQALKHDRIFLSLTDRHPCHLMNLRIYALVGGPSIKDGESPSSRSPLSTATGHTLPSRIIPHGAWCWKMSTAWIWALPQESHWRRTYIIGWSIVSRSFWERMPCLWVFNFSSFFCRTYVAPKIKILLSFDHCDSYWSGCFVWIAVSTFGWLCT